MKKNIIKSTALIMIFTLVAKFLGFVKSMIQASYFGASATTDAFNIAQGFSSNILTLIATAISVAFVPIYLQYKLDKDRNEKAFASSTLTFFLIFSICFSVILYILAGPLMKLAAPSYSGQQLEQTISFFRFLLIGFLFAVGTSIYQQLLNAEKVYGFSAASSLINSAAIILCIILLEDKIGIWSLAGAFVISYAVQNIVVGIRGRNYGVYTFKYGIWNSSIKNLLLQSAPIFVSQGTVEINQVVDKALLAKSGEGAVTAVSYAAILYGFVSQLLKTSFSTVLFTEFSELSVQNKQSEIKRLLVETVNVMVIVCLPLLFFASIESDNIIKVVYGHGNYNDTAVSMTTTALAIYIFCLLADVIKAVVVKAYYSFDDTKRPMVLSVLEVITNILISVILSFRFGMAGVVLGTIIAENIWLIIMLIDFNRKHLKFINGIMIANYWKTLVSVLLTVCMLIVAKRYISINAIVDLFIALLILILVYGGALYLLKEENVIKWGKATVVFVKSRIKHN